MTGTLLPDGVNVLGSVAQAPAFDPADNNIDEVKAYVEANPLAAKGVLAKERDGENRVTLVEWLEGQIPFDVSESTVEETKTYVESHEDETADVLEAEKAGENRVTLVEWLEARLAPADDTDETGSDEDILG